MLLFLLQNLNFFFRFVGVSIILQLSDQGSIFSSYVQQGTTLKSYGLGAWWWLRPP